MNCACGRWLPCLTDLGHWIACGAYCLSRQELMHKNTGTHSSRLKVEARPAASDTAKRTDTAGDALGCSSEEAFDRRHILLFGHSPAHQVSLSGSLCFVCSKLHLQAQPVVPVLQILHDGPHPVRPTANRHSRPSSCVVQTWQAVFPPVSLCC